MQTSSAASRIQANLQDLFKANLSPGESHIRFQLTSEITALLSMEQVQESLVVNADKITALPTMPESVIGVMSSRNRVFCVFDLAQLLDLPSPLGSPRTYQVVVLQTTGESPIYIGFAVARLQGIVRISENKIQSATKNSELTSYIYGEAIVEEVAFPILAINRILKVVAQLLPN